MTSAATLQPIRATQRVEPRSTIVREGEVHDALFVVLWGQVDLYIQGVWIATVGPGGIIGNLPPAAQQATAIARTSCSLLPIDHQQRAYLAQQTQYFPPELIRTLVERMRLRPSLPATGERSAQRGSKADAPEA